MSNNRAGRLGASPRRTIARSLAAAAIAASALLVPSPPIPARAATVDTPDVVVILTDDQRWDTLDAMPTVRSELMATGTTFTNAFVSNSLCCPSRSSILTGRYSHTTGVWRNRPPFGGWASFDDSSTIATHLDAAGYETGLFGKYLNGYWDGAAAGYVPPGWDRWVAFSRSRYYDYRLSVDGTLEFHGDQPSDYSTDVLASQASDFIRSTAGPMFVYFAPFAPHAPATPAVAHAQDFSELPPWRPLAYDEPDMSDKPAWAHTLERWDAAKQASKDVRRLNQYRSLQSVDGAIGQILLALADTGRLQNTLIVFMSDNGLSWGEHRWSSKTVPYEEAIRIPMVVRFDPLTAGAARTEDRMTLNIDVAPTIYELTGIGGPTVDGSSILPLLVNAPVPWRQDFLLEHLEKPSDKVPTYCGVRTDRYKYVYYGTGEEELYDLQRDGEELQNAVSDPVYTDVATELRTRLSELCQPAPPGLTLPW